MIEHLTEREARMLAAARWVLQAPEIGHGAAEARGALYAAVAAYDADAGVTVGDAAVTE